MFNSFFLFCVGGVVAAPSFLSVDPVFTPYKDNGDLNLAIIPAYLNYTKLRGADEILLGGSTGEWPSLSVDERLSLLDAWIEALDKYPAPQRPSLLFHVGSNDLRDAKRLAQEAARRKVNKILIVAPSIFPVDNAADLATVIGDVAASAPSAQAFYYHYPAAYVVDVDMVEFLALAPTLIPTLKGIKFIDHDMRVLAAITDSHSQFEIYCQTDFALHAAALGAAGTADLTFQHQYTKDIAKGLFGTKPNVTLASEAQHKMAALDAIMSKFGTKSKSAAREIVRLDSKNLGLTAIDLGNPRLPLQALTNDELSQLNSALRTAGFPFPGDEDEE